MKLVIFNLDQTLVDLLSIHNKATEETFKKFFNVPARLTEVDFTGKSLIENFIALAKKKNIPEDKIWKNSKTLLQSYEKTFIDNLPKDSSRYILPGAKKLLENLSDTNNIVALYTGNSEKIVSKVLKATNLKKYLRFSMYGTEVNNRADMIKLAIEKAKKLTGKEFKDKDIVIIGDSVRDIESGKQFNALTIAVATGFHSEAQLAEAKPGYIFKDLTNYREILKIIGQREEV